MVSLGCLAGGLVSRKPLGVAFEAVSLILEDPEWADIPDEDALLRYLRAHRESSSMIVCSRTDGGMVCPTSHRADEPRPLASSVKIAVLVAYADAVVAGRVAPDEPVSLAEWERWYLPGTDGGAHARALETLGVGEQTTLDTVVAAMIAHSDNAATDLVLDRLGFEAVDASLAALDIEMDPLHPLLGEFLLFGSEVTREDDVRAAALAAVDAWEAAGRPDADLGGLGDQMRATGRLDHRASARSMARLVAATYEPTYPQSAREIVHHHLQWPMRRGGSFETLDTLGTKGGALPGVLTEVMVGEPSAGPQKGEVRIVVLLMDDMPLAGWFAAISSFAHQQLMLKALVDPEAERSLAIALSGDHEAERTATPAAPPSADLEDVELAEPED